MAESGFRQSLLLWLRRCLVTQGMAEDKWAEAQAAAEAPEVPEADEEGKPLTKKARAALLRAAEKERERRRAADSERIDPEVRAADAPSRCRCSLL